MSGGTAIDGGGMAPGTGRGEEASRLRRNKLLAKRRARDRTLRQSSGDQRTRVARRIRAVEAALRAQLRSQGRVVTVHDDLLVGSLAHCQVVLEMLRAEASRGHSIDPEEVTRATNACSRLVTQLGLRPETAQPEAPRLAEYLDLKADRT
jgi:hypothetical protein